VKAIPLGKFDDLVSAGSQHTLQPAIALLRRPEHWFCSEFVQYWTALKAGRMQHTIMDDLRSLSEKSEQNLRWLAWETKNRREDRILEKRVKLAFVFVAMILLASLLYASRRSAERPVLLEDSSTLAL